MHRTHCIINNLQGHCLRPPSDCELTQDSDRKNAHNLVYRVNPNLTSEKQLILVTEIKAEDSRVFQEELTLLGNFELERCQIELLQIHVRISEISIPP